jgi:hypothetical protein
MPNDFPVGQANIFKLSERRDASAASLVSRAGWIRRGQLSRPGIGYRMGCLGRRACGRNHLGRYQ